MSSIRFGGAEVLLPISKRVSLICYGIELLEMSPSMSPSMKLVNWKITPYRGEAIQLLKMGATLT